eukprot:1820732-Pyramimonas_sp.AAC.1
METRRVRAKSPSTPTAAAPPPAGRSCGGGCGGAAGAPLANAVAVATSHLHQFSRQGGTVRSCALVKGTPSA